MYTNLELERLDERHVWIHLVLVKGESLQKYVDKVYNCSITTH